MKKVNNKSNVNEAFAAKFKKCYCYKMGGTQTIILPNGQIFRFDDRDYYSGRGAKYNSSINHHTIGDVIVSKREFNTQLRKEVEQRKSVKAFRKSEVEKIERYAEFKEKGIYELKEYPYGTFVILSDDESALKTFDAERLAKTLDISITDAELLSSRGKTYVFAKQKSSGKIIELYHSSLSCNNLSISVDYPSAEYIAKFNHSEWASAPYAGLLGQTGNVNHFVC